jgi:O-antigen/teichoic acid export membrane protein
MDAPTDVVVSPREADDATRGSAIKLAAECAGRGVALVTALLVARGLGVAGFGVFAAVSGVAVIAAEIADLGLQALAAQALVAGTVSLRALLQAKLRLTAIVVAAAVLAVFAFPLFAGLLLYYTFAGWSEFLGVALRARGRRLDEAGTILCLRVAALVSVLAVGGLAPTPLAVAWALAGAMVVPVALGAMLLRHTRDNTQHATERLSHLRKLGAPLPPYEGEGQGGGVDKASHNHSHGPTHTHTPTDTHPTFLALLRVALPLGINGGLALLSLRLEVLALKVFRGDGEAGVFAAALRIVESLILVPSAISAGAMPALTREALRGDGPVRGRTALTVALLGAPSALGLAVVAPNLVGLLFGDAFAAAALPLRILALALAAVFLNAVLMHTLIATGRTSWLPRLTAARVTAAAVLGLVLIPTFGATGAAVGFFVAELLMLVLAARACAAARFGVPLARPLALGLGLSVPMALTVSTFLSRGGPVTSVALGVVIYAATLMVAWRIAPGLFQIPRRSSAQGQVPAASGVRP